MQLAKVSLAGFQPVALILLAGVLLAVLGFRALLLAARFPCYTLRPAKQDGVVTKPPKRFFHKTGIGNDVGACAGYFTVISGGRGAFAVKEVWKGDVAVVLTVAIVAAGAAANQIVWKGDGHFLFKEVGDVAVAACWHHCIGAQHSMPAAKLAQKEHVGEDGGSCHGCRDDGQGALGTRSV